MKVVKFKEEHLNELLKISNEVFGEYFLNPAYLNNYLNSEKNKAIVALSPDNKVVGFLFLEQFLFLKNSSHFITDAKWFNKRFPENQHLTIIKQIALTSNYQNKGVGKLLLNEVNQLKDTTIVCIVWDKGKETPLRYLLSKNNFSHEHIIENYWSNDSIEKNYFCEICGQPPCTCNAEIYIKKAHS